ncbi:MAG: N-acetylneuraminate synthase [Pseudomonadota bacterium]
MRTFVIAEAGVNHNGSLELAGQMIDAAIEAGADAIKFQTFTAENVVSPHARKAAYQEVNDGAGTQFDLLKQLELSEQDHLTLMAQCDERGIEFMSTPFDTNALDFLVSSGIRRLKIPSGEITNHPFLEHIAAKGLPMIVSTGMATMVEVCEAIDVIASRLEQSGLAVKNMVTVLHCTSNYPTRFGDVNLRAMALMGKELDLAFGYSDHTNGIAVCPAAVAIGASVVEKHFTLDRTLAGPDHNASIEPAELKAMIAQIRDVELAMGSCEKGPTASEEDMRIDARRSITAAADLQPGDKIENRHLSILRPATGIHPKHHADLVGKQIARPVAHGAALQWEDLVTETDA